MFNIVPISSNGKLFQVCRFGCEHPQKAWMVHMFATENRCVRRLIPFWDDIVDIVDIVRSVSFRECIWHWIMIMFSWFLGVDLINQICKTVTPRVFPCDPIAKRDFVPRISVDYPVGVQEGMDVGSLHGKAFPSWMKAETRWRGHGGTLGFDLLQVIVIDSA